MTIQRLSKYFIFIIILLYTSNWLQINLLLFKQNKNTNTPIQIQDHQIIQFIKSNTGISLKSIKIHKSEKPFGVMIGIPTSPIMILSSNLYETFSFNELEYVILHESGHYVLHHSSKEFIYHLLLIFLGIIIINKVIHYKKNILLIPLIGFIFGIIIIQLSKLNEYQADRYALTKISNPEGMITATHKFQSYYQKKNEHPIIRKIFYRSVPYSERIQNAQKEIIYRSKL